MTPEDMKRWIEMVESKDTRGMVITIPIIHGPVPDSHFVEVGAE